MNTDNLHKLRKEVYLTSNQIKALQSKADKQQRSLKNYMEFVLISDIQDELVKIVKKARKNKNQ